MGETEPTDTDQHGGAAVMRDVARMAGVSKQTVSRVLNGSPAVRPETRTRVLAAVAELGYLPNQAARALTTGESRTIGVIAYDVADFGPANVVQGIALAAQETGYMVSVAPMRSLGALPVREAANRLLERSVDGLITIAPHRDIAEALLDLPRKVPVVAVDASLDPRVPVIAAEQLEGSRRATEQLLHLGHRTVHHLAGPRGWIASGLRRDGWLAALVAAGAPVPEPLVGDWTAASGYELGRVLATDPEVTAVHAANDQMAVGLLRALYESGRRVPEHVSVIGFDDVPEAAYTIPPLSTVRVNFADIGRRCISVLVEQLRGGATGRPLRPWLLPTELVVRASTGRPPAAQDGP
ncbi:LacI family DNA-binding transcriptional regulator [Kitasatospora sp. NPDC059327]|uniref:LacI family DNA-binding transcriptional regulator n=1 Tax=Kitasatospora sp. NPDC059327 TaxID=3346803 RepID=UPI0036894004